MASSTRPELVQSAITFLLDPSAQSAPLAKRIAFLESKGLTSQEIDEAIRLSNSPSQLPPRRVGQYGVPIQNQVQDQGRDWRDWFIMAVIGGSVGYLTIALARKYLLPSLQPPSQDALSASTDALTAKYDEAAALLKSVEEETKAVRQELEDQTKKVDESIADVKEAIGEVRKREVERDEELKSIKEEVEIVRDLLPKMIEKNKEAQTSSLADLSQELRSLKSLLMTRRTAATTSSSESNPLPGAAPSNSSTPTAPSSSTTTTPTTSTTASSNPFPRSTSAFPNLANRQSGIPAWQRASPAPPSSPQPATQPTSSSAATPVPAPETSEPSAASSITVNGDAASAPAAASSTDGLKGYEVSSSDQ